MDKDTSDELISTQRYRHLEGGDILYKSGDSAGTVVDIKGNEVLDIVWATDTGEYPVGYIDVLTEVATNPYSSVYKIRGVGYIRDDIVLLYAGANSYMIVDLLKYDEANNRYIRINIFYEEHLDVSQSNWFVVNTRYENEASLKVYFSEKNNDEGVINNLRYLNVAPDIVDGVILNNKLQASYNRYRPFPTSGIESLGKITSTMLPAPTLDSKSSGDLYNGVYQYCYRYFNEFGNKSGISDLSELIHLSKSGYTDTRELRGGLTTGTIDEINSNKAISISIPTDTSYTHVEVIRLWYSSFTSIPTMAVIRQLPMSTSTNQIITDSSFDSVVRELDYNELNALSNLYSAKAVVDKDDVQLLLNIDEDSFDIDFDARVYQYDSGHTCQLQNESGASELSFTAATKDYANIPEENDCVNPTNKLSNDFLTALNGFKYNEAGTLGADGLNVHVTYTTKTITLESSSIELNSYLELNTDFREDTALGRKRFFQSDEIYRLGLVFRDTYGRFTPAKWMGDLRMPSYDDLWGASGAIANSPAVRVAVPRITVNTAGTEAEGLAYKIVYVKREKLDRTVVTEGLMTGVRYPDSDLPEFEHRPAEYMNARYVNTHGDIERCFAACLPHNSSYPYTDVMGIVSPEVLYNKDTNFNGCRLDVKATFDINTSSTGNGNGEPNYDNTVIFSAEPPFEGDTIQDLPQFKMYRTKTGDFVSRSDSSTFDILEDKFALSGSAVSINGIEIAQYAISFVTDTSVSSKDIYMMGNPCTTHYVALDQSVYSVGNINSWSIPYVRVRKDTVQYGGRSYEARQNNVYISASELTTASYIDLYFGDTFITMFEYQRTQFPLDNLDDNSDPEDKPYRISASETVLVPVQSTINTNFRSAESFCSLQRGLIGNSTYHNMQVREEGLGYFQTTYGRYSSTGAPTTLTAYKVSGSSISLRPLYEYNSVYSKINNAKLFISTLPTSFDNKHFDTRIRYSDKKNNGELYDSWLIYKTANFKDLDNKFGSINNALKFNNEIVVWQDNATAFLVINPNVQMQGDDGISMYMGTGKFLHDVKYLSTDIGLQGINEVVPSISSIYWLDNNKKKIYRLLQGLESVSDTKLMNSYFAATVKRDTRFIGVYDNSRKTVIATLLNYVGNYIDNDLFSVTYSTEPTIIVAGDTNNVEMISGDSYNLTSGSYSGEYILDKLTSTSLMFTRVNGDLLPIGIIFLRKYLKYYSSYTVEFDEMLDAFKGFQPYITSLYLKGNKQVFSTEDDALLYEHNVGNRRTFYGIKYDLILDYVSNKEPIINKKFEALTVDNQSIDETRDYENIVDYDGAENITFDGVRVLADRNMTEYIDLHTKDGMITTELINGTPTGNIDPTVYNGANRVIHDTNGIRIIPYPTHLYNVRMTLNKFRLTLPRIKTGRVDSTNNNKLITELVRGTTATVRLVYSNITENIFKVRNIITHFTTNEIQ